MIQKTKKFPHSPMDVLAYSENKRRHTLRLRTQGQGRSAEFYAKLNKKELEQIVMYIEQNFSIHKEDF